MNKKGKMITGDEAIVTKKQHKVTCSDCPFRRDSIPGWLGQLNVDQWVQLAHGEGKADCHTQVQGNGEGWACAGLAIYRANVCKSVVDRTAMRLPADRETVFSFGEFRKHHESSILSTPVAKAKRKGPKTEEEIDAEVAALREMKPRVRRFSMFGDDHHKAIDLQIEVLEERMDDDQINDLYEDDEDDNSHAREAVQWMAGETENAPSVDWKELVR